MHAPASTVALIGTLIDHSKDVLRLSPLSSKCIEAADKCFFGVGGFYQLLFQMDSLIV